MLGSAFDADDAVQEALLRAWRGLARFEARSSLRNWLYTVVTRTCLDMAEDRGRRALPVDLGPSSDHAVVGNRPRTEVAWLTPYPDVGILEDRASPEARYEQREAVELAFAAALQHLPGNQRAALLLFDVVGLSAAEIAAAVGTTTAGVNSALQRARRIIAKRVPSPSQQTTLRALGDARVQEMAGRFASALERGDAQGLVALLTEDITWSMPPFPSWYHGLEAVTDFAVQVPLSCGGWRHLAIAANGQPTVALYLWDGTAHLAWSINVLTLSGARIGEITSFVDARHFQRFGLPTSLV
jgi:RNA polymerase sigma-70 factor (ECF subfamily)